MRSCASLKSLCLGVITSRNNTLSLDVIKQLSTPIINAIWQAKLQNKSADLEDFILFAESRKQVVLELSPQFNVYKHIDQIPAFAAFCKHELNPNFQLVVNFDGLTELNLELMLQLTSLPYIAELDLRNVIWPIDLDEIDRILHIIERSGALKNLVVLRLPLRGPTYLLTALKREWGTGVRYLQSPVKPLSKLRKWYKVREIRGLKGLQVNLHLIGNRGSTRLKNEYTKYYMR